ncbi:MAG: histidine phosphatase family protein [Catenulispora sp.]|nr:histidine phosphatase family protein [Catenulispora sp.]
MERLQLKTEQPKLKAERRQPNQSLILVRHAMPDFSRDIPARDWPLSADGREAAATVAAWIAAEVPEALLVASSETKAVQTLAPAGEVRRDARFDEVERVEPFGGEFRRLRREYVGGVEHVGWEPRARVVERFDAALREHGDGRTVVVATHGMALTLWVAARIGVDDPVAFWEELRFPDVLRIDVAARNLERVGLVG